jgi:hypothetical protein
MKKSSSSFILPLLFLGACFHLSYQSPSTDVVQILADSAKPVQFSNSESINEAADFLISDLQAAPMPYSTPEATIIAPSFEDKAYKVADILTVVARLIIALTGAIFGIKKIRN